MAPPAYGLLIIAQSRNGRYHGVVQAHSSYIYVVLGTLAIILGAKQWHKSSFVPIKHHLITEQTFEPERRAAIAYRMALMESQRREKDTKAAEQKQPKEESVASGTPHEETQGGAGTLRQASRCCGGIVVPLCRCN